MEFHPYLDQQSLQDFCNKNTDQYETWSPFMVGKVFALDFCKVLAKKYDKSIA
ncbi:MAG: diketogulonate reductase-like aldo/keto reductase [Maribacter sp.]|jgi:diketogulonate reductase-like aldo/keto reductase